MRVRTAASRGTGRRANTSPPSFDDGITQDLKIIEIPKKHGADCTEDMLFYVWRHGYEPDIYGIRDRPDTLIGKMAETAEDGEGILVTNAEFYRLSKDQISSSAE